MRAASADRRLCGRVRLGRELAAGARVCCRLTPPPGETGPLFATPDDSGFIHAPSMTHAAAAALLRNAHLGASGVPQPDGSFAIDLSLATRA